MSAVFVLGASSSKNIGFIVCFCSFSEVFLENIGFFTLVSAIETLGFLTKEDDIFLEFSRFVFVFFLFVMIQKSFGFNMAPKKKNVGLEEAWRIGIVNVKRLKIIKWMSKAQKRDFLKSPGFFKVNVVIGLLVLLRD
jgi:hypothetical protein